MKRIKCYCAVSFAALCVFAGCAAKSPGIKGSGVVKTELRGTIGFTSVSLETMGHVTLRQTGKESLTITAEDNLLPLLTSNVSDHVLTLAVKDNADIKPTKPIEFVIEVKDLGSLNVSGAGSIKGTDIRSKQLSVSLSGVGNVKLAGAADKLYLRISGVGNFNGEEFKTVKADVTNSGVGKVVVNVSKELSAKVSGLGLVEYIGAPVVYQAILGSGSVHQRQNTEGGRLDN